MSQLKYENISENNMNIIVQDISTHPTDQEDLTVLKKNKSGKKKEEKLITSNHQQHKYISIYKDNGTEIQLFFRFNENKGIFAIKKQLNDEQELLNEINNLSKIKDTNITLPIIDSRTEGFEQEAGQKDFMDLKESFNTNVCFCETKNKCQFCEKIDDFFSYLFIQLFDKLYQLHQKGIAHSDIKPKNLVLSNCNQPYFIDLGGSVPLTQFQQYFQQKTPYFNLEKYLEKFNFENEEQVKQFDRSQLALSWLYMKCWTVEELKLFKSKEFEQLILLINKDKKRNKFIDFIAKILNESDNNFNIDNVLSNQKPLNEYNIYFDQRIFNKIINHQIDIIYDENKYIAKRINQYSIFKFEYINNYVSNVDIKPDVEIRQLQFKNIKEKQSYNQVFEDFCNKYNIMYTYLDQLTKFDYRRSGRNTEYNFLEYLQVSKDKVFKIYFAFDLIDNFKNLIETLQNAENRSTLQIYIYFKNPDICFLHEINEKILQLENCQEQIQLLNISKNECYEQNNLIFECKLIRKSKNINNNKYQNQFHDILYKITQSGLLQRLTVSFDLLKMFQINIQLQIIELQQKNQQSSCKIQILKNKLYWIIQQQQNFKFSDYKVVQERREQLLTILQKPQNQNKLKVFLNDEYKYLQQQKYNQFYMINKQNNLSQTNTINDINNYKQLAQAIDIFNIDYNRMVSEIKISEMIRQIEKFISLNPLEFIQIEIILNNFVFESTDFWDCITHNQNQSNHICFKISLVDCLYNSEVIQKLIASQKIFKYLILDYNEQNVQNCNLMFQEYQIDIKFEEFKNKDNIIIQFLSQSLNQYCQTYSQVINNIKLIQKDNKNLQQYINENETQQIEEQEIRRIFKEQQEIKFNGNYKYEINTNQNHYTFNIQNQGNIFTGQKSLSDLQQINEEIQIGKYYEQINELTLTENEGNLEIIQHLFKFTFLICCKQNLKFEFQLYIKDFIILTISSQHCQDNPLEFEIQYYSKQQDQNIYQQNKEQDYSDMMDLSDEELLEMFSKKNKNQQNIANQQMKVIQNQNNNISTNQDDIPSNVMFFQIINDCLDSYKQLNKDDNRDVHIRFKQNMNDGQFLIKELEFIEGYFSNQYKKYYFDSCDLNDNSLQSLYNKLKEYKEMFLSILFKEEKQLTLFGIIQFIDSLLLIGNKIGFVIHFSDENDDYILRLIFNYFSQFTNCIEHKNFYLTILMFPKDPKRFIEFEFKVKFKPEQPEQTIERDKELISRLKSIYSSTSKDQLFHFPQIQKRLFLNARI